MMIEINIVKSQLYGTDVYFKSLEQGWSVWWW